MSLYELVLDFDGQEGERVRTIEHPVEVGDALTIDGDVWLVLREDAEEARNCSRFQCRRALGATEEARKLVAQSKRLNLLASEIVDGS